MKIEHKNWMGAGSVLAALVLCAQASAQHAGGLHQRGNLANDIHDGGQAGRGPVRGFGAVQDGGSLQLPQTEELSFGLSLEVEAYDSANLQAVFPGKQDMKKTLRLSGRPFQPVELLILPRIPRCPPQPPMGVVRVARGFTIRGEIGADGSFAIELPPAVDTADVLVQGYSPIDNDFTSVLDLDQAVAEAYLSWTVEASDSPSHGSSRPTVILCPANPGFMSLDRDAQRIDPPSHGLAKPAKQPLFAWDAQRIAKPTHLAMPARRALAHGHVAPMR